MTFPELLQAVKEAKLNEIRFDLPDYLEIVTNSQNLEALAVLLNSFFGKPFVVKTQDMMSQKVMDFMENFGGIRAGQQLYFLQGKGVVFYTMIWPWGDGKSVTLKIGEVKGEI